MAIAKQKATVRKNIKKAAKAAKRTLARLPRTIKNALGNEEAAPARRKRSARRRGASRSARVRARASATE
jgi:hypothetical protein